MKYLIYLFFSLLLMIEEEECTYQCNLADQTKCRYEIDIPLSITPYQRTFSIGDTIWIESTLKNTIYNKFSKNYVRTDSVNYGIYFEVHKIDTSKNINKCIGLYTLDGDCFTRSNDYNVFTVIGDNSTIRYSKIMHKRINNQLKLKIGFVPKETGVFTLYFKADYDQSIHSSKPRKRFYLKCNKSVFAHFKINEWIPDGDNYSLLKKHAAKLDLNEREMVHYMDNVNFRKNHLYFYKVVE